MTYSLINKQKSNLKHLILLIFFSSISFICAAQSTCNNIDFENGNFDNWVASSGFYTTIDTAAVFGIIPGRHTIMSGNGYDPHTNNKLSVVAPGGSYSCRLGNDEIGAKADRLRYTFQVNDSNALFIYKYAVVLEDPNHTADDQPKFEVAVVNNNGTVLDSVCGYYKVISAGSIPGFQGIGNIRFKDWTTVGMDLTSYIGQQVTIQFTTYDCDLGGHFGYAYIDAFSQPLELNTIACYGDSVRMHAPDGFAYLWNPLGLTEQNIVIPLNSTNEEFTCQLTSVTGCIVELSTSVDITRIIPGVDVISCNLAEFSNTTIVENGEVASWNWDFGDPNSHPSAITSELKNPQHYYKRGGAYDIKLSVETTNGCKASEIMPVEIISRPHASFNLLSGCIDDDVIFNNTTIYDNTEMPKYFWDFGDEDFAASENTNHFYYTPGTYSVTLRAVSGQGCSNTFIQEVFIDPCDISIPNIFTPNNDALNDYFRINNIEYYPENKLMVFNRWGNIVFKDENYKNNWSPAKISDGVYFYVLSYTPLEDTHSEKTLKGFVTITGAE